MLKRLRGLFWHLLVIVTAAIIVAATTLAPSYRECARNYEQQQSQVENQPASWMPKDILLVIDCEGDFLQQNAAVLTAIGILLVAFFTLALQRSTGRLWKANERQIAIAEKAVETARLSAEAAVGAERAHLFVGIKASNLEKPLERARLDDGPEPDIATPLDAPSVEYVLSNYGRTVALLREVKHALVWESPEGLRSYQPGSHGPLEVIAPHADSNVISCRFRGDFTSRDARAIVTNKRALLFYGEAIFLDAFGHARGVKWQCRCAGGSFDLIGCQEFEADHKENSLTPV